MTTTEYLCRHFSRVGARLKIQAPRAWQREKVRIDVGRDRDGEFFDVRCQDSLLGITCHLHGKRQSIFDCAGP